MTPIKAQNLRQNAHQVLKMFCAGISPTFPDAEHAAIRAEIQATPAARAAAIRDTWPCRSTVSIESPPWRDNVDDAVEMTTSALVSGTSIRGAPGRSTPHAGCPTGDFTVLV